MLHTKASLRQEILVLLTKRYVHKEAILAPYEAKI